MGFLQRIFGTGKTGGASMPSGDGGGRISLHRFALSQKLTVTTKRCDVCGSTFAMPSAVISVLSDDVEGRYHIDVGGYCMHCRKYTCQQHAKFVSTGEMATIASYEVGCRTCGTPLKVTK